MLDPSEAITLGADDAGLPATFAGCVAQQHLRSTVRALISHYQEERPHQGLDNALIAHMGVASVVGLVRRRKRLGGRLSFSYRAAA
jgi:hypothetical protein